MKLRNVQTVLLLSVILWCGQNIAASSNAESVESSCPSQVQFEEDLPRSITLLIDNLIVLYDTEHFYEFYSGQKLQLATPIQLSLTDADNLRRTQITISPNDRYILETYTGYEKKYLLISEIMNTKKVAVFEANKNWHPAFLANWLNGSQLLVPLIDDRGYFLIDMSTNETQDLYFSLPQLHELRPRVVFNSYLTRVAYSSEIGEDRLLGLTIWNLESDQLVKEILEGEPLEMTWSPSGESLATKLPTKFSNAPGDLAIFDHNGSELFRSEVGLSVTNHTMTWSPDDRLLAVQTSSVGEHPVEPWLQIIEIKTKEHINICLLGDIIWASNGKYAAIVVDDGSKPGKSIFVYDTISRTVYPLNSAKKIVDVLGWPTDS